MNAKTIVALLDSSVERARQLKEAARGKNAGDAERDFQEVVGSYCDAIRQFSPPGSHYPEQMRSIVSNPA